MGLEVRTRGYIIPVVITNPGAVTNFQLTAHTNRSTVITRVVIKPAQAALVTDAGARIRLGYKSATATGLTSIAATTFVNLQQSDADAGFTTGHTATGEGTDGDFYEDGWRSVEGFDWFPTPEEYIHIPGAGIFMIKHNVAPPAGNYSFKVTAHEIG
jgi:hypothetical protein